MPVLPLAAIPVFYDPRMVADAQSYSPSAGKPREVVGWRGDAYKALRKLGSPDAVATAILELAEPSSPGKRPADLLELAPDLWPNSIRHLALAELEQANGQARQESS